MDKGLLIYESNIHELKKSMKNGDLTANQLVSYCLKRIHVYDAVLNSMISLNPNALLEATKRDEELKAGKTRGLLHGIPIILKDNYNTFDMKTTSGAKAFAGLQPPSDAFTVDRLRKAGAIIIGKANLTEMANHGMTVSSMTGQTLNPYDLTRTPGGSSGGTGAAIAANFAVAGTASDTVNSIRSPASANSLVGIRPSRGLVSRTGISPCSSFQDIGGPITRTVADAAIMLQVMAGYDPEDSTTEVIKGKKLPDYTKSLHKDGLKGKTIALLTNNIGNHPEVLKILDQAVKDIEKLGASVIAVDAPELLVSKLLVENDVQQWEQKTGLNSYLTSLGDAAPVKDIEEYVRTGLITPSVATDMQSKAAQNDPENDAEYLTRLKKNADLREFVLRFIDDNNVDALLYPLQTVLVVKVDDPQGQTGRNGLLASVTGLPAITLPGGFSSPTTTAPQGVPIGIELMGKPFSEPLLIQMGYAYEQATKHRLPPVSTPNLIF